MSLTSWVGLTSDPEQDAANKAADQKVAEGRRAAVGLSNYRQSARDQYHRLLTAETQPYQGASNWLAALTGSGMSTSGLSAAENPLSLRDTGVGSAEGSNYNGYTTYAKDMRPGMEGRHAETYHEGIGAYLDHQDRPFGTALPMDTSGSAPQSKVVGNMADPGHSLNLADSGDVARPTNNPNAMGAPQSSGQGTPQYRFMPRMAP